MAVVRSGRITLDVPEKDGTCVDVVVVPRRVLKTVEQVFAEIDELNRKHPFVAPDPETLERWIDAGRE